MKKSILSLISVLGISFLIAMTSVSFAADIAKIGVVDFQKVITESDAGKALEAELKQKGEKMQDDLKQKGKEIDDLSQQLAREAMVMSSDKREEMQRELEIKKYDFQALQKKYENQLRQLQIERLKKIQDEILKVAENIGKREGYLLIVDRNSAVYYPEKIDITDQIIREYNEKRAKGD